MKSNFVKLKLLSPEGETVTDGVFRLPVTVGRGEQAVVSVANAPATMSRVHARLHEIEGALCLTDESTHGIQYHGRLLRRDTVKLLPVDRFEFTGYKLEARTHFETDFRKVLARASFKTREGHALVTKSGRELTPVEVGPNAVICLLDRNNRLRFESMPHELALSTKSEDKLIASYRLNDMELVFIITIEDARKEASQLTLYVMGPAVERNLLLNRHPVDTGIRPLDVLDLLEIDNKRIELLPPYREALRCTNPDCERLNAYDPNGNCQWCGQRLVESITIMR